MPCVHGAILERLHPVLACRRASWSWPSPWRTLPGYLLLCHSDTRWLTLAAGGPAGAGQVPGGGLQADRLCCPAWAGPSDCRPWLQEDKLELAKSLEEAAKKKGIEFILPTDVIIANKFAEDAESKVVPVENIPDGWMVRPLN